MRDHYHLRQDYRQASGHISRSHPGGTGCEVTPVNATGGSDVLITIERSFEVEIYFWSPVYLRVGTLERYWKTQGLPDGSREMGTY